MAVPNPGRADVVALRRSDRSKPLLLGVVCLVALGAATFSWAEQKGSGAPDDPTRVLVVSDGESEVDHMGVLERAGFVHPAQASLAEFEERAGKLELDGTGVEAVLALADDQGYGFVVFEDPQRYDFGALELQDDAPELADHVRYAVLSVGDLAFPHHLSVNPEPSDVVRMPGIELLQALYEQARLHPERELLSHHPTVEELHLQAQLEPGLFVVRRVEMLESTASNLAVDIEKFINTGDARPLALPLESGGPVPLPDGGVLSVTQGVKIVSRDAFILDYVLDPILRLEYTPAAALLDGPDGRETCAALAGGVLPVDDFPELVAAADGRTILLHTASEGLEVWSWLEGPGCGFTRQGRLPSPQPGEKGMGVPSPEGVVARVADDGGGFTRLRLYEADPQTERGTMVELAALDRTALGKPTWLSARYVASGARRRTRPDEAAEEAVFLFDAEQPERVLRLDVSFFGPGVMLRHMAPIPGDEPAFLVTTRGPQQQLYRVSFTEPIESLFQREPEAPQRTLAPVGGGLDESSPDPDQAPPAATRDPVIVLAAEDVSIELVHEGGRISNPAVSPDGRWVSFSHADADEEKVAHEPNIALLRLDPPATELVLLSEGPVEDLRPRFTADGRHVVFETRVSVNFAGHELVAPRVAAARTE